MRRGRHICEEEKVNIPEFRNVLFRTDFYNEQMRLMSDKKHGECLNYETIETIIMLQNA